MPYLVKVGYEIKNLYGVTSKGYFIKRIGSSVYTEWGAIDVIGLKIKKFAWHKTTASKTYKFRSIEKALAYKKNKISFLIKRGYNKLPSKSKIYSRIPL
jgi:hypothetical protein